jgi:hypothetical protein
MVLATAAFFVSLVLIIGLFVLRMVEERRGARFGARPRHLADNAALNLKDALVHGRTQLEKLPPEVAHMSMRTAHKGALGAASLARSLEAQAHRFADFVSSKGSFQRREPKSEFLNQVQNFKQTNTGGESADE